MNSRSGRYLLCMATLVCMGFQGLGRAQDFEKVQIKSVKAAEGVYMLAGYGGNIGASLGEDGVLLIDSQFGQLHEKIKAAIAAFSGGSIRFVLNTNWHYDHALGNELFRKAGAVIVAHANSRMRMTSEQIHDVIDARTPSYPAAALPEVTFADSLSLHFNGDDIQAIYIANAHSDADVVYHFRKANVLHVGDLFFSGGYPYIDIGNGGSIDGMIAAADRILAMTDDNTKVIPGHGPLSDCKGMQEYRAMLAAVRDRVAQLIKEGKGLEEVIRAKPTADLDKAWSEALPPEMFVILVYKDLVVRNRPAPLMQKPAVGK